MSINIGLIATVTGLVLVGLGITLILVSAQRLIRQWWGRAKRRLFGKKPPKWPEKRYRVYEPPHDQ